MLDQALDVVLQAGLVRLGSERPAVGGAMGLDLDAEGQAAVVGRRHGPP